MQTELEKLISLYRELEIDKQIDYDKFYLYSLITGNQPEREKYHGAEHES